MIAMMESTVTLECYPGGKVQYLTLFIKKFDCFSCYCYCYCWKVHIFLILAGKQQENNLFSLVSKNNVVLKWLSRFPSRAKKIDVISRWGNGIRQNSTDWLLLLQDFIPDNFCFLQLGILVLLSDYGWRWHQWSRLNRRCSSSRISNFIYYFAASSSQ